MSDKVKGIIRIVFGALILFIGTTIALLLSNATSLAGTLGRSVGLAFIITGCVWVFREIIFLWLPPSGIEKRLEDIEDEIKEGFSRPGMRMLSEVRRGHPSFHEWKLETKPQTLLFAGHSVLHRIQKDFKDKKLASVEEAIRDKLLENSTIRILFLDIRWDLLDTVAKGEGQSGTSIRVDIATTLGVCKKIWERMKGEKLPGTIEIRRCRELVQYAFQYMECSEKGESKMLCGLYFAGRIGAESPLLLVEGSKIQDFFLQHFKTVFNDPKRSELLLIYSNEGTEKRFDHDYYKKCKKSLLEHKLDPEVVAELMPDF